VYRTIKEIFRIAFGERAGAYDTKVELQLLELYNEDFIDLLQDNPKAPRPDVRIIPDLGVVVDNVVKIPVNKLEDALAIVKKGYTNRTVRGTNSNALSSRSHSILTLHLTGTNNKTKKTYVGKLHFVDLAGSERVGKSGVTGDALKEAQAINKSLSALGDVIQALSNKDKFIPFRNSQLTKLLQESLGGNSKTVMICNVAPCQHSLSETVNSLRFATRAHKVEMGKATANASETTEEVKAIKGKLADLESKFKTGKGAPAKAPGAAMTPRSNGRQSTAAVPPAKTAPKK
jgi:kinesin family protein C2/C3